MYRFNKEKTCNKMIWNKRMNSRNKNTEFKVKKIQRIVLKGVFIQRIQ